MASCYLCGSSGAQYRRTVHTGSSYGITWGKKSSSRSSRQYYGLRTVCEDCAARVDKMNAIFTTLFLIAIAVILLLVILK